MRDKALLAATAWLLLDRPVRLSRVSAEASRNSRDSHNSGGNKAPAFCVLRCKWPHTAPGGKARRAAWGGDRMYALLYWTGMMTLVVWGAYSAYSAITGL
jgi:hypothetical protein